MEATPSALIKILVPRTPLILKIALLHSLWLSDTSSKWDLRTELTIKVLRHMIGPQSRPQSISKQQHLTTKDPGVKGQMWISRVTMPIPPEDDLRQLLFKAVDDLKEGTEEYSKPSPIPIYAEWTGFRSDAQKDESEPSMSELEKYEQLMKEVKADVTLLYFHGGAMFLLDPTTYRPITSKLAKLTGGRVFSVRYRLSPQNPFPAALLDALTAYLSLLYPPPGSPHAPVSASNIVFGGDSAGGLLSTALLQTLLQIHRSGPKGQQPTVQFNGEMVEVPMPAGLALNSPWVDVTRSSPSIEGNAKYDYLPAPSASAKTKIPPCPAWPSDPPRVDLYCEGSALCHPLVSPLAARSWEGSPPIFIVCGEEQLADEDMTLAQRIAKQGGQVVWEQFEAMPHCFAMMLEGLDASTLCFTDYASFCRKAVEDPNQIKSEGSFITAKTLVRHRVDVMKLIDVSDDEVTEAMKLAQVKMIARVDNEAKSMPML